MVRVSRRHDWNRARRTALHGQSTWRAERKAKDDRCSASGLHVALALRDGLVRRTDADRRGTSTHR